MLADCGVGPPLGDTSGGRDSTLGRTSVGLALLRSAGDK